MANPYRLGVNIRGPEKCRIKEMLQPGRIIQICGPPMVGKSTIVFQALTEMRMEVFSHGYDLMQHHFQCENDYSFQDVLWTVMQTLNLQALPPRGAISEHNVTSHLHDILGRRCPGNVHHVLVFHKCQDLRTNGHDHEFLDFLMNLIWQLHDVSRIQMSVVFTTYKQFPMRLPEPRAVLIEIDVLTDFWDVIFLLRYYAPNAEAYRYAHICLEVIPFPLAVRRFAEEYLLREEYRDSPERIEEIIDNDMGFFTLVFKSKLDSVETWIPEDVLSSIMHFSQYFKSSFAQAHLEYVSSDNRKLNWNRLLKFLKENYVVRDLPDTDRLIIHPLVVYYCRMSRRLKRMALQGHWYDHSCNRYTQFLCHVLNKTDINMRLHGKKGQVYGCLVREWPHVRHMIDMALHCNENTYKTFLKAAVSARGLIMRCFLHESYDFYSELYKSARKYGTSSDCAVLQSLIGHTMAASSRLATGLTWQDAEDTLDEAIDTLQLDGPPFSCMWAMYRKGIILSRQGKHRDALTCFKNAKRQIVTEMDDGTLEDTYGVSPLQVKEEKITLAIFEANCFIATQQTARARVQLLGTQQQIIEEFADHPELATLLNSLGLADDRDGNREGAVVHYKESLAQRRYLDRIFPEILVIPLCNIGKICVRQGKLRESKKYLTEALRIRKKFSMKHPQTALVLKYLGQLYMKSGDFMNAFKHTLMADIILKSIVSQQERADLNNMLAHQRQLLNPLILNGRDALDKESDVEEVLVVGNVNDMQIEDIDFAKLAKSSLKYFQISYEIAEKIKSNLVDEGHDGLLVAREHAMLFHLVGSKEKFKEHMYAISEYIDMARTCRGQRKTEPTKVFLQKHADLFTYITETEYEALDKKTFVRHLLKACEYCSEIKSITSNPIEKMWFQELRHAAPGAVSPAQKATSRYPFVPERLLQGQGHREQRCSGERKIHSWDGKEEVSEEHSSDCRSHGMGSTTLEKFAQMRQGSDNSATQVKLLMTSYTEETRAKSLNFSGVVETEVKALSWSSEGETELKVKGGSEPSDTVVKELREAIVDDTEQKYLTPTDDTQVKGFRSNGPVVTGTEVKTVIETLTREVHSLSVHGETRTQRTAPATSTPRHSNVNNVPSRINNPQGDGARSSTETCEWTNMHTQNNEPDARNDLNRDRVQFVTTQNEWGVTVTCTQQKYNITGNAEQDNLRSEALDHNCSFFSRSTNVSCSTHSEEACFQQYNPDLHQTHSECWSTGMNSGHLNTGGAGYTPVASSRNSVYGYSNTRNSRNLEHSDQMPVGHNHHPPHQMLQEHHGDMGFYGDNTSCDNQSNPVYQLRHNGMEQYANQNHEQGLAAAVSESPESVEWQQGVEFSTAQEQVYRGSSSLEGESVEQLHSSPQSALRQQNQH